LDSRQLGQRHDLNPEPRLLAENRQPPPIAPCDYWLSWTAVIADIDPSAIKQDLDVLLNTFFDLIACINEPGNAVETCLGEALGLPFKMFHHIGSALTLLKGTNTFDGSETYLDHPSVSTLCRAAWEASILFAYVAANGSPLDERRLRIDAWKHASIGRRLQMSGIAESETALVDATAARDVVLAEFEDNPAFVTKSEKERERLLDIYRWSPGWWKLADIACILPKFGKDHYSYLCEQAHPGYVSVLGLASPASDLEKDQFRFVALGLLCASTALAIETLIEAESFLKERRACHPEWYATYDAWIDGIKVPPPSAGHN
jgi:hypothetical protein